MKLGEINVALKRRYLRKARKFCGLLAEPNISGRKGRYETCN
jgi:hypothetical protein